MDTATLRCAETVVDRHELTARIERTASGLVAAGVVAGERVALLLRNCIEFIEISIAAGRIGAFVVPINWHFKPGEIEYLLDDSAPRIIFVHKALVGSLPPSWRKKVPVVSVAMEGDTSPHPSILDFTLWRHQFPHLRLPLQAAPGSIVYTSGTTGRPKGVQRCASAPDSLEKMNALRAAMYRIAPTGRIAIPGPLYHAFPNQFALHAAMGAAHLEIVPRFDPEEFLALIARERITSVGVSPIMFVRLLRLPEETRRAYDLSSLEWAIHAGGPCAPDVKRAMIDWWGPIIGEYYGGTETGPLTLCSSAEWLAYPGTCGKPIDGVELRIIGDDGKDVPRGTPGEIYGRLWHYPDFTYRNDPEKRDEVALGDLITLGDIGYQNTQGYLFLCDRVRDMIISGGVNIYPAEVEGAIFSLNHVDDCAVVGVPDDEYGERVIAFVCGQDLSPDQITTQLREQLAGYKVPREIIILPSLDRDASGKLRKGALRNQYLDRANS